VSSAQLQHALKVCQQIVERLPQVPQKTIQAAQTMLESKIPPFWPTYRAGVKRITTPEEDALLLDAGAIEGAVVPAIVKWAQKVFPLAGMAPPVSAADYVHDAGGAYPERIESQGSPDYPGNRAVGGGRNAWLESARAARDELRKELEAMTR
jgi:hypothetical protein